MKRCNFSVGRGLPGEYILRLSQVELCQTYVYMNLMYRAVLLTSKYVFVIQQFLLDIVLCSRTNNYKSLMNFVLGYVSFIFFYFNMHWDHHFFHKLYRNDCLARFGPGDPFCVLSFRYMSPASEVEKCGPQDRR